MSRAVWYIASDLDLPHVVSRPDQVIDLANAFVQSGWDVSRPALIGYPLYGKIQLLSGTHRCAAARLAQVSVPVVVIPLEQISRSWGTDEWTTLMKLGDTWFS